MDLVQLIGRAMKAPTASPPPEKVKALREQIQTSDSIGITAAQDLCAGMLHTSRRAWQQWERGERNMHPAFWELISIKSGRAGGNAGMATADEPRRRHAPGPGNRACTV